MTQTEPGAQHQVTISPLFGVVAPSLGWVPPPRFLLRRARVLRMLGGGPLGKLLEVGCGAGALLHEMAGSSDEAVGIETSRQARSIAEAIALCGGGKQHVVDAPADGWNSTFDLICAFEVLEHIENDHAALQVWVNWLRAGGRICISVPAHRSRWNAGDEWAGHWRRYDRGDVERLVGSAGLELERVECYGFPLGNITEAYGARYYRQMLAEKAATASRAEATSQSGVDRTYYLRRFHRMDSLIGRGALRVATLLQSMAMGTDLGCGYLVLARKA